jgi:hypothetical protein
VLASLDTYPAAYGAYLHPWLTERNGEIIYFTMSRWFDYNVFLMRARVLKDEGGREEGGSGQPLGYGCSQAAKTSLYYQASARGTSFRR